MGRKALFIVLAAVVALALVPAGASAAKPLTEERAFVLASKLGREVAKDRNVRYWRIQRLVKRRTNRFVYEYFERLREDDRFCRANVVVQQSGTRRTASLTGSRCGTMPADALALEELVADAIAAVKAREAEVRRSLDVNEEEHEDCVELDFPRAYENQVYDFLQLGTELSLYEPVMPELGAFADRLSSSGVTDPVLVRGIASWRKYLEILAELPPATRHACPALLQWSRENYAESSKPVDFTRTSALLRSLVRHGRRILAAADRLDRLGVSERTYVSFTPNGLVLNAL